MDDEVFSTHKDNDRSDLSDSDNRDSDNRDSEIIANPVPQQQPIPPKPKRKFVAFG